SSFYVYCVAHYLRPCPTRRSSDLMVLEAGESVYIDSNMGHAYIAAKGCDEVLLLGVCSSSDDQLLESLMTLHGDENAARQDRTIDRKSTRLNSSHVKISYAVFCLK